MTKVFPLITGVAVGVVVTVSLIIFDSADIAHGDDRSGSRWNEFLAKTEAVDFGWHSVFSSRAKGQGIYKMVYKKVNREGANLALREVALSYGLTTDEASAVLGGSLIPIFQNPRLGGRSLTHEDAIRIYEGFHSDYERLFEIYDLQQEIELLVKPSEMFANGDITDSGFDLVHDLSVIEEILFLERTPTKVGGSYAGSVSSPYNPIAPMSELDRFIADAPPLPRPDHGLVVDERDPDDLIDDPGIDNGEPRVSPVGRFSIGDEEKIVPILEDDICEVQDNVRDALEDFESEDDRIERERDPSEPVSPTLPDDTEVSPPARDRLPPPTRDENYGTSVGGVPAVSGIKPAPASDWKPVWCFGHGDEEGAGSALPELQSLGGVPNSYLVGSMDPGGGKPFTLGASLCLDINLIKETAVSYESGATCVMCELEFINEHLDKTLSHSLIPNKATGNLMESAKAKNLGTLMSMNLILIQSPVPTAAHSDTIYGKNIFEEWNKFVERYQPIYAEKAKISIEERPDLSSERLLQVEGSFVPGETTQIEVLDRIDSVRREAETEARLGILALRQTNDTSNVAMHLKDLLAEMGQMNTYFLNFLNTYTKLNDEVLPEISQKKTK